MKFIATILTLLLLANCNTGTTTVTKVDTVHQKVTVYDTIKKHITITDTFFKRFDSTIIKFDTTFQIIKVVKYVDSLIRKDTFAIIPIPVDKRLTPYLNKRYKGDSSALLIKVEVEFKTDSTK